MKLETQIWALVPAAGAGARVGAPIPKQYLLLLGRPVIIHTLERLAKHPRISGVFVGLSPEDRHWPALNEFLQDIPKLAGTFTGSAERAGTVLNGLKVLAEKADTDDWVLVHDAVRPCLRQDDIDRLIERARDCPAGAVLGVPITDTIKRAEENGRIIETVSRVQLWRALTPQCFRMELIKEALEKAQQAGVAVTDESMAVERLGQRPCVIRGHSDNIKITLPGDLAQAELFMKQQTEKTA